MRDNAVYALFVARLTAGAGVRLIHETPFEGAAGKLVAFLHPKSTRGVLTEFCAVKPGATVGEEVLGAYEVKGGRPVTVAIEAGGQVVLKMGEPRRGANPVSPEKMLRKAAAEAVIREKNRPKNTRDRR